jgi:hypothetical protein
MAVALYDDIVDSPDGFDLAESTPGYGVAGSSGGEFFGMWKDRPEMEDVDGYVRKLRSAWRHR